MFSVLMWVMFILTGIYVLLGWAVFTIFDIDIRSLTVCSLWIISWLYITFFDES